MNIFFRELKANRKALIIWSICMFLFVLSGMSKYTAYSTDKNNSLFNNMPHTVRALLGILDFDVTKMSGFFAMLYPYLAVVTGIHAALLGSGIIGKEERDKTTEFLMVKPLSRSKIITSKLVAALINVIIVNLVTLISSIVLVRAYNKGKDVTHEVVVFILAMLIIQLIFLSLGALIAAIMNRPKASGTVVSGILFGAYFISKITDLTDKVNFLNILSPFKYFEYKGIVNGGNLNVGIVLLSLMLVGVFSTLTYLFYLKRDLKV